MIFNILIYNFLTFKLNMKSFSCKGSKTLENFLCNGILQEGMRRAKWEQIYFSRESRDIKGRTMVGKLSNVKLASPYSWPRYAGGVPEILMTDLNIIRADVDLSLLAPGRALIDNHPLLRPLELVGESYGHNLNISS